MAGRPNSVSAAPDFGAMMADSAVPAPEAMEDEGTELESTEDDEILGSILTKMGVTKEEFTEAVNIVLRK